MFNPDTAPVSAHIPSLETAARSLKVAPIITPVHSDAEIEAAIIALGREPAGGLVVITEVFTNTHRASIMSAAARNNVPAVYGFSYLAREGGLLSYGADRVDTYRRAATNPKRKSVLGKFGRALHRLRGGLLLSTGLRVLCAEWT